MSLSDFFEGNDLAEDTYNKNDKLYWQDIYFD